MIAVIRVRGTVNVKPDIKRTMEMLRLYKPNNMVLVPEVHSKMVEKIKDYVTYGKLSEAVLVKVLEKRGRVEGKKLTPEVLKEKKILGFEDLAKNLAEGKANLRALGIEPVFRLSPPRKGYDRKGIKTPFALGGALGNRGDEFDKLVLKMI